MVNYFVNSAHNYLPDELSDAYQLARLYAAIAGNYKQVGTSWNTGVFVSYAVKELVRTAIDLVDVRRERSLALQRIAPAVVAHELLNAGAVAKDIMTRLPCHAAPIPISYSYDGGLVMAWGMKDAFAKNKIEAAIFPTVAIDPDHKVQILSPDAIAAASESKIMVVASSVIDSGLTIRNIAERLPPGLKDKALVFATNTFYAPDGKRPNHVEAAMETCMAKGVRPYIIAANQPETHDRNILGIADVVNRHRGDDKLLAELARHLRKPERTSRPYL